MVQTKLSLALILAATTIAPAVSQPLSRREENGVTGSAFSKRFASDSADLWSREGEQAPHPHHRRHKHKHHHHHHKASAQTPQTPETPQTPATQDPNTVAPAVTPREFVDVEEMWAREGEQVPQPHHRRHKHKHHHHHHHKASAETPQTPQTPATQDPNTVAPAVTPREFVDAEEMWAREGEQVPQPHHRRHKHKHHHHHHHKASAETPQTPQTPATQDPNTVAPAVTPREFMDVEEMWAREGEQVPQPHHRRHKHKHHHHHHHKASAETPQTPQTPATQDPNTVAPAVTPREFVDVEEMWAREGEQVPQPHHRRHKHKHHHHHHKASAETPQTPQTPQTPATQDPNTVAPAATRREYLEYLDDMFERSFDELDLD